MHNNRKRHYNNNNKNRNRPRFQNERPSINKVYDSNGPTGRQRGNASTLYEKYINLARDAGASGDRVLSENFMQHAEHYLRILHTIQEQMQASCREQAQREQQLSDEQPQLPHEDQPVKISDNNEVEDNISVNGLSEKAISKTSNDVKNISNEKPVIRRKSYPFARRKPNDTHESTHNKEDISSKSSHEEAVKNTNSVQTENEHDAKITQDKQEIGSEKKVKQIAKKTLTDLSQTTLDQKSDSNAEVVPIKKRRIVRKKVVLAKDTEPTNIAEKNTDISDSDL